MTARDVYDFLKARIPDETRDYLKKVTKRMLIYDPYFNGH